MASGENPKPILEWPDSIEGQLKRARDIKAAVDAGTTGIDTTALGTAITNAQTAEDDVGLRKPGAVSTRDDKFSIMKQACVDVMDLVREATAGLSYDAAKALIEGNGFHAKGHVVVNKDAFEARHGELPGEADLIAKGYRESSAHEWYYSPDKLLSWVYIPTTLQAKTHVAGLPSGLKVTFRHRAILKDGPTTWDYDDLMIL